VVGPDDKVSIRTIQTGPRIGALWIVNSGLAAGDRVIAEGTQKVKDGTTVTPVPYAPPAGSP
jgi:hypothetical protein